MSNHKLKNDLLTDLTTVLSGLQWPNKVVFRQEINQAFYPALSTSKHGQSRVIDVTVNYITLLLLLLIAGIVVHCHCC